MTWLPHCSYWGKGDGCYSSILNMSLQCFQLKWFRRTFQIRYEPGKPVKDNLHWGMPFWNMIFNTWGRCSTWLTSSQLQSVDGSVLCIRIWCTVIYPAARSTPQYGNVILLLILSLYVAPIPCALMAHHILWHPRPHQISSSSRWESYLSFYVLRIYVHLYW